MGTDRQGAAAMLHRRSVVLLIALAAVVVGILGATGAATTDRASSDVVDVLLGRPDPATEGVEGHLAWGLDLVESGAVPIADVRARLSAPFLAAVPPQELLDLTRELDPIRPLTYRGMRLLEDGTAEAVLEDVDGADLLLGVAAQQGDPDRIGGLLITPEQQPSGPFTALELAALLVAGASLVGAGLWRSWRVPPLRGDGRPRPIPAADAATLLALAGLLWLTQLGEAAATPAVFTVGLVAGPLALAAVVGAVVIAGGPVTSGVRAAAAAGAGTRPSVRPSGRLAAIVAAVLAAAVACGHLLAVDTAAVGLASQPLGPDRTDASLAEQWLTARAIVAAVAAVVVSAVLVRGVVGERRPGALGRRAHRPRRWTAVGGSVLALVVVVLAVTHLVDGGFELSLSPWLSLGLLAVAVGVVADTPSPARATSDGLAGLVADLGELPEREDLEASLARALDDPDLRLAYVDEREDRYVDARGAVVDLDDVAPTRAVTHLETGEQRLGAVVHDRSLLAEPGRVQAACAAVRLALDNERLQAVVRARLAEVRASRVRIVEAEEAARRQVERDLHDGAQQRLLGVLVHLRLLGGRVVELDTGCGEQLDRLVDELGSALEELRELAQGLHPSILDHGLVPAVQSLAETSPVPVEVEATGFDQHAPRATSRPGVGGSSVGGDGDRAAAVEAAAHFVVREAVANAARHADATLVRVELACDHQSLAVAVTDDGRGGAHTRPGGGLQGLADRVNALEGSMELASTSGEGTTLRVRLPV